MSALFHPYLCGRKAAGWLTNMNKTIAKDKRQVSRYSDFPFRRAAWILTVFSLLMVATISGTCIYSIYYATVNPSSQANSTLLFNMQATTLAITSLSIAVAGTSLSLLGIYREKKVQQSAQRIEEMVNDLDSLKKDIPGMINLIALQGSEYSAEYIDNIAACLKLVSPNDASPLLHSQMCFVLINTIEKVYKIYSDEGRNNIKKEELNELYNTIINYCDIIAADDSFSHQYKDFAKLKRIFYLYHKSRLVVRENPEEANSSLKLALRDITVVGGYSDSTGQISALCGQINLWYGKTAEIKRAEKIEYFKRSMYNFQKAINNDGTNDVFYNAYAVVIMNIAMLLMEPPQDLKNAEAKFSEAQSILRERRDLNSNLSKIYLNIGDCIIHRILIKLNVNIFPSFVIGEMKIPTDLQEQQEISSMADEAITSIEQSIALDTSFLDGYYQLPLALILKLLVDKTDEQAMYTMIEENLKIAKKKYPGAAAILQTYRTYYDLRGDSAKALEYNTELMAGAPLFAEEAALWEKSFRATRPPKCLQGANIVP